MDDPPADLPIASSATFAWRGSPATSSPAPARSTAIALKELVSGPALKARVGAEHALNLASEDQAWDSVAWALAQLCHVIVCAAAPRAIAIGGGVTDGNPHLLARIETMLVESLNGYMQFPDGEPYVRAPALGSNAGPLGAIALAMSAKP